MKKTLYLSILAAALMGGQVFADYIPTTTDAPEVGDRFYVGEYSQTADVSRANVTINEEQEGGADFTNSVIMAGSTTGEGKTASHNSITMTGGQVGVAYGGSSESGKAEYNTATITGGITPVFLGGISASGNVTNNAATASGGEVTNLYGGMSQSGEVSNNTVSVSAGHIYAAVTGGQSRFGNATNNTVTVSGGLVDDAVRGGDAMIGGNAANNSAIVTGGQVAMVSGGYGDNGAANNSAIVTGGQVGVNVSGGECWTGSANGNTVVLSGCIVGGFVAAGLNSKGDEASNNHVYLLGKGANAEIGGKAYTGSDQGVTVAGYVAAYYAPDGATTTGNSIEVYGTAITAATLSRTQMVNFHIADGVLLSQEAMVSLTSTSDGEGLDLTGVELGFNAADVQDWGKYEGQSITLVTAAQSITIDQGSLGDVEIKNADGLTVATATLALGGSNDVLSLSNIKGVTPVPEPTTGALSLLALAGLCIRRRK